MRFCIFMYPNPSRDAMPRTLMLTQWPICSLCMLAMPRLPGTVLAAVPHVHTRQPHPNTWRAMLGRWRGEVQPVQHRGPASFVRVPHRTYPLLISGPHDEALNSLGRTRPREEHVTGRRAGSIRPPFDRRGTASPCATAQLQQLDPFVPLRGMKQVPGESRESHHRLHWCGRGWLFLCRCAKVTM